MLREKYAIREFQRARVDLDSYYSAINTLALLIKANASKERVTEQVEARRETRERLRKSLEGLGFIVQFAEDEFPER